MSKCHFVVRLGTLGVQSYENNAQKQQTNGRLRMPRSFAESVEFLPAVGAILKALVCVPRDFDTSQTCKTAHKLTRNELGMHGHVVTFNQNMELLLLGFFVILLYFCLIKPQPGRDAIRMMRG